MNTNQLNCFVEVAKSLSFARAADKLFISQPAVSHQISSLENELGCKLFYRTRQKVELTSAGEAFYLDAVAILNQQAMAAARARTRDSVFNQTLKIGYDYDVNIHRLPEVLRQYHKTMPQVYISNQLVGFSEKSRMLTDGHLDVGFMDYESASLLNDFQFSPIFQGHFVFAVPKNHRLAARSIVSTEDVAGERHIFLSPNECPPKMDSVQKHIQIACPDITVYFSNSVYLTSQMILGGLGIGVMPNFVCPSDEDLKMIPFETKHAIDYGITCRRKNAPKRVTEFARIVKTVYAES